MKFKGYHNPDDRDCECIEDQLEEIRNTLKILSKNYKHDELLIEQLHFMTHKLSYIEYYLHGGDEEEL